MLMGYRTIELASAPASITSGSMPRRLAEMAHARPIGPAPAMITDSGCIEWNVWARLEGWKVSYCPTVQRSNLPGIRVRAQQLVQPLPQIRPDRVVEIDVVRGEHVLNVDRVEPGAAGFFDDIDEVEARFLDEGTELIGSPFADGERQQVEVARRIEPVGEVGGGTIGNVTHERDLSGLCACLGSHSQDSGTRAIRAARKVIIRHIDRVALTLQPRNIIVAQWPDAPAATNRW